MFKEYFKRNDINYNIIIIIVKSSTYHWVVALSLEERVNSEVNI